MLQYKIPQNIGIEDKIVGPFSLRQLIILAVGAGISYTLFAISSRLYELNTIEYVLIALPAIFSLALAMVKIHNVTFAKYILLMIEFAIKPKKRMWDHRGISALVAPDLTEKKTEDKNKSKVAEKSRKNVNLSHLSAMLDSGGFEHMAVVSHEDIDKVNDDDLITEAYFGHKKKESSTGNMYWRTREVQKKKLDLLAKIQTPATVPSAPAVPAVKNTPVSSPTPVQIEVPATSPVTEKKEEKPAEIKVEITGKPEIKKESVAEHLASVIKEARKNNEAKNPPAPQPAPKPSTPPKQEQKTPKAVAPTPSEAPKKKRKRKKKPKLQTQPVRQDTQVNTTSKSEPNKLIKKSEPPVQPVKTIQPVQPPKKPVAEKAETPPQPVPPAKNEKETSFSDLSGGDEIEINLD